jgi:hypothetical protein
LQSPLTDVPADCVVERLGVLVSERAEPAAEIEERPAARFGSAIGDEPDEDRVVAAGESLVDVAHEPGDRVHEHRQVVVGVELDAANLSGERRAKWSASSC